VCGVPVYVPAVKPVPNYTAWWQRHMCVNNLPKVVTQQCPDAESNLGTWVTSGLQVRHITVGLPSHIKVLICRNELLNTNAIIHDYLTRPCRRCNVRDIMQPFNTLPPCHALSQYREPPTPSMHDIIYGWPLDKVAFNLLRKNGTLVNIVLWNMHINFDFSMSVHIRVESIYGSTWVDRTERPIIVWRCTSE